MSVQVTAWAVCRAPCAEYRMPVLSLNLKPCLWGRSALREDPNLRTPDVIYFLFHVVVVLVINKAAYDENFFTHFGFVNGSSAFSNNKEQYESNNFS